MLARRFSRAASLTMASLLARSEPGRLGRFSAPLDSQAHLPRHLQHLSAAQDPDGWPPGEVPSEARRSELRAQEGVEGAVGEPAPQPHENTCRGGARAAKHGPAARERLAEPPRPRRA